MDGTNSDIINYNIKMTFLEMPGLREAAGAQA